MITTHIYNKKLNGTITECQVCGNKPTHIDGTTGKRTGSVMQHHIGGKTYDDRAIWVCYNCHQKIHNPTSFGLPASWAYDNYYLLRRNSTMAKEKKSKACSHSKTYNKFDDKGMHIMCSYCGKEVNQPGYGKKTKKTDHIPDSGKKIAKMGYDDKQPPHIIEAAKLKQRFDALKGYIKKTKDAQKRAKFETELAEVHSRMKQLQAEYDLE